MNKDICGNIFELILLSGKADPENEEAYEAGSSLLREILVCEECKSCPFRETPCLLGTHPDAAGLMERKRNIACKDKLTTQDVEELGKLNYQLEQIERECTCTIHQWSNAWRID